MHESVENLYRQRLEAVRAEFAKWEVDGVLIGNPANRRWLSGFTGSAGWLLVTEDEALIGTDFRYWDQVNRQAPAFELFAFKSRGSDMWLDFFNFARPARIGVEARHMTLDLFDQLQAVPNVTFVKLEWTLEELREIKSVQEMETIEKAAAITDMIMGQVNQLARAGMQERDLAWELERHMRENGATGMAFPIIVASGPNAAMAHHQPGERTLREGDPLIVDMGAEVDGYASDLTRTFFVGRDPDAKFQEIFDLVHRAQNAALSGMRAGVTGAAADSLARDVISDEGYGEAFGHSLGHGLGLEVHEGPSLSQMFGQRPLAAGAVVTVEPGIYLPDWGGVRIEDLAQITEQGVDAVSQCPKIPVIPG
jgi:Xaa-Pro aminopeptidase